MTLNEADTRAKLIDPAIHKRGWTEDLIRREETAGTVEIINGKARRRSRGKIDYVLRVKVNVDTQPVALALIEAKKESLPAGHGLDQAKGYSECKRLNVRFVFSSNGHQFVEFDCFTGLTSAPRPMAEFPTPAELRARYEEGMGFNLESPAARPLLQPYPGGEGARRYYQDAAIRAVMEKVARDQLDKQPKRALLSLATGAGKTFIAVNLLKRISDAGQLTRALFVCDRDELRTQALRAFQNVFGSDAAEVYRKPYGTNNAKNARIHIATYQTLGVENDNGDANFLTTFYPEDYFTHIVIDECHRSAWGKWSQVLKRNRNAVQIGLTATPRQFECKENTAEARQDAEITANNIAYFGEPVYEYDIAQAIEDGYLAACEIQKGRVNLDDTGITIDEIMARNPVDAITGLPVVREQVEQYYVRTEYEDRILLPDRVLAMCQDLFNYLLETGGPEQKTIIFCARDHHADDVAACMNNLYAKWCADNLPAPRPGMFFVYVIECDDGSHYIGQTDDIQRRWKEHSAGTAAQWTARHQPVKIAHFEEFGSREEAIEREKWLKTGFGRKWLKHEIAAGRARQAGGRQRLDPYAFKCTAASSGNDQLPDLRASSRSHFIATTVDLLTTGVDVPCVRNIVFFKYLKSPISFYQMVGRGTRIDPPTGKLMFRVYDYTDATRLFGEGFITKPPRTGGEGPGPGPTPPPPPEPTIRVEGFDVHITDAGRFIVADVDGRAMPVPIDEYKARLAARLVQEVHTLDDFRARWIDPPSRQELIDTLVTSGYSPTVIRMVDEKEDYDLYDVLAELGWGMNPRTRHDRTMAFTYKHEDWINALPDQAAATIRAITRQFERGGTEGLENPQIFQTPEVKAAGGLAALQAAGNPRELLIETKTRMFAA